MTTQAPINVADQIELNQITAISRKGDSYTVHYTDTVQNSYKVADKVYTGNIGMNGKLGVSRVYKSIREVNKTEIVDCVLSISMDKAVELNFALKTVGIQTFTSMINSKSESKENGQPVQWSIQVVNN